MTPGMRREAIKYLETEIAIAQGELDVPSPANQSPAEVAEEALTNFRLNGKLIVLRELQRALVTETEAPRPAPAWFKPALATATQLDGMAKVERESGSKTLPWVLRFAHQMEKKLALNRHKGDREGWINDEAEALMDRLRQEVDELAAALEKDGSRSSVEHITGEAADVANFAMMIADVCGGLEPKFELEAPGAGVTDRG